MLAWIISSSILILVIIALRFIIKGKISPVLMYGLWLLVFTRLFLPVTVGSSVFSIDNIVQGLFTSESAQSYLAREIIYENAVSGNNNSEYLADADEGISNNQSITTIAGQTENAVDIAGKTTDKAGHNTRSWLFIIWAAGSAVILIWSLLCNIHLAKQVKKDKVLIDEYSHEAWMKVKEKIHFLNRPVYVTDVIETPCLIGLLHPAIYIPTDLCNNDTMLSHAVLHEIIHFRHGDHIWSLCRVLCTAVHWFNPFVWMAAFFSKRDCEIACDDTCIKYLGNTERAEHGRTLIKITAECSNNPVLVTTSMSGRKSAVFERVCVLASKKKHSVLLAIVTVLFVVIVAGCTFSGAIDHKTPFGAFDSENFNRFSVSGSKWTINNITSDLSGADSYNEPTLLFAHDDIQNGIVTFAIIYDSLSRPYITVGDAKIDGDSYVCNTFDEKFKYTFKILEKIEDGFSLEFDLKRSVVPNGFNDVVPDKTEFIYSGPVEEAEYYDYYREWPIDLSIIDKSEKVSTCKYEYSCFIDDIDFKILFIDNLMVYAFYPNTSAQDKAFIIQSFKEGVNFKEKQMWSENVVTSKDETRKINIERQKQSFWKYLDSISIH